MHPDAVSSVSYNAPPHDDIPDHGKISAARKPYRYGLTPARKRLFARTRLERPEMARELHVWTIAVTSPYTTLRSLADACALGSGLSLRTWQRVAGEMLERGEISMGADGYEPGPNEISGHRTQVSRQAVRKLAKRVGDHVGPRDPSERAKRVRRVIRYGKRTGRYYSSERTLAKACAKNGSGTVEGYRTVVKRMLANAADLERHWDGSIDIVPDF